MIVVTGFLGSGKTTLLSRVLAEPSLKNTAVLVNEFGEVGLDHHLLRRADEMTVLLGNGCVCCATRHDLVGVLLALLDEGGGEEPERVVLETSGLADPAPILFTVLSHPILQHHYSVERVICTVDALSGHLHLQRNAVSTQQVAAADLLIMTKTDVARPDAVTELHARLQEINPSAPLLEASHGGLSPAEFLRPAERFATAGEPGGLTSGSHTSRVHSTSLTFDGPIDWTAFGIWFSMLLHARGEDILRVKGLLNTGEMGPVLLNGVQHVVHPPNHLQAWPDGDRRSRVVFIARDIHSAELLDSLESFRSMIGASPRLLLAEAPV